ncbi:MAG TPA: S41 family peptidase, partial [Gemmatimonadales bacterium]|nr:S41 family peptidase [Gemmatimonadales bacterium]
HSYVIMYQPLVEERAKALESGKAAPVPIAFRFVGLSPVVGAVAAGSEAARQDILPGDELVAMDGGPVTAESAEELDILLSGPKGSRARLTLERQRSDGVRISVVREVKRERVAEESAVPTAFMLDDSTGYVRVTTFASSKVADELRAAVGKLEDQKMRRLLLDLRNNGGGSVSEAADVAGLFLPKGMVIAMQEGRKKETNDTLRVSRSIFSHEKRYPLVVLINAGTASASELVAGALQDHDRALIVGQPSFGKSLVMRAFLLPEGSVMWMVTGHERTPCGRVIQRQYHGITTREYYRRAAAERDTVGRPSCRTDAGRTVYGGGGIYPDVVLRRDSLPPLWLERVTEQLLPLKWVAGYLGAHPDALGALEALASNPVLPAGAAADFRAFVSREGLPIPAGAEADNWLTLSLLPLLAEAKWGATGLYRVSAMLDGEVRRAIAAFAQATAMLGH